MRRKARTGLMMTTLIAASWVTSALAQPPAHAPAHGYRNKHRGHAPAATITWEQDFDVLSGSCNRQQVATVIGGIVGGALANEIADGEHRRIATLIGAAAGALIGNRVGKQLDEADRGCVGHVLELGTPGRMVRWSNDTSGIRYEMTPGQQEMRGETACRSFTLAEISARAQTVEQGLACQTALGTWEIRT